MAKAPARPSLPRLSSPSRAKHHPWQHHAMPTPSIPCPAAADTVLSIHDLSFGWPGGPRLFEGLNLRISPGVTWVTGEESCGKTTLLRLMAGECRPLAGRLCLRGHELDRQPEAYRAECTWIDPQTQVHDALTADAMLASVRARRPELDGDAWDEVIDGLGLEPHRRKPLYMLSTGSRRKVWLAMAMLAPAALTLLDQPFAALDAPSARFVRSWLQDASEHPNRAWVIADHTPPEDVALTETVWLGPGGG